MYHVLDIVDGSFSSGVSLQDKAAKQANIRKAHLKEEYVELFCLLNDSNIKYLCLVGMFSSLNLL